VPGTDLNYFGIDRGRNYNVKDLLADNANAYVWTTNRSGADLIDNGLYVGLPNNTAGTGSYQAQYLQLIDRSAPSISFVPPQLATYGTAVALSATVSPDAPVIYSLVSGDTDKVSLVGNQLAINSGTGSVVVRATVASTADREGTSAEAIIEFQKMEQEIGFWLPFDEAAVGQEKNLVADTYHPGTTNSTGLGILFTTPDTNAVNINGSLLSVTATNEASRVVASLNHSNYRALSVTNSFRAVIASFRSFFGTNLPNSDTNGDGVMALTEYALGGTSGSNNRHVLPTFDTSNSVVGGNTNRVLSLTALVRTNDPKLTVSPQFSTTLATNSWSSNNFTTHETTAGVTNGFVRRTFTYTNTNNDPRAFLRLFITNAP